MDNFFQHFGVAEWAFSLLSGAACYYILKLSAWLAFVLKTHRRIRHLNVNCFLARDDSNYPCKLYIEFKNWTNRTLLLKLEGFEVGYGIQPDPNATRDSTSGLLEIKFIEQSPQGGQIPIVMNIDAIIRHAESRMVWVPLDIKQNQTNLDSALREGTIGVLKAEILWFDDAPRLARYRPKIRRS